MATKTFDELKQLAIQIRDEKTNKQNTATRVGTTMLEHINKLEQDYYDKTTINNRTSEYNVSLNHPTSGISGGNKYDLSTAIAQVPSELRSSVNTVSFLNENGNTEKWEFGGGSWAVGNFSQVGAERFTELNSKIIPLNLSLYEKGIGYKLMEEGYYYDSNGILAINKDFFACRILLYGYQGKILHFKNLSTNSAGPCSWVKEDGNIENFQITKEQDIVVPDDAESLLVSNNGKKEDSLITYIDNIPNNLLILDYKSNGFNFDENYFQDGYYNQNGLLTDSSSFKSLKILVSSISGETINIKVSTNSAAPCSWVKEDGNIENFQITKEQDIVVPDDAKILLVSNNLGVYPDGYFVKYQTKTQEDILTNKDYINGRLTYYDKNNFESGYYDYNGNEKADVTFVKKKINVQNYIGSYVYLNVSTNSAAPCSWVKEDGSIENFQVTKRTIVKVPENSKTLLVSNNLNALKDKFYAFISIRSVCLISNRLLGLTNYEGLKFTSFGDSVTEKGGWQDILISTLNLGEHTNCGVGGSWVSGTNTGVISMNQDERINAIPEDTELLTFLGGTNDFYGSALIGEETYNNEDIETFFGALNVVAKKVVKRCPNARIFFMSIYAGIYNTKQGWSEDLMVNGAGLTIYDYRDAIKKCAYMHGIPFIDLIGEMQANRYNVEKYFSKDGVYAHPNDYGKEEMAKIIIGKMLSC